MLSTILLHDSWFFEILGKRILCELIKVLGINKYRLFGNFIVYIIPTGIFIMITAYLSFVLTVYMFAFQDFSIFNIVFSYILDMVFFIKIVSQFNISYSDKYGDYVISRKLIKKWYTRK